MDARWTQCTPSEYAWERSALAYLKSVIPDREPYRAWANAEFIGADGSVNEIDLLLIAPAGIILRRNLIIYGIGVINIPFIGIKMIDVILVFVRPV